ncbi:MAG TPA: alpha-galactosidase [Opitutaceae bacterium]|nr:alpha-galactosidase [Opitutaceae bacterium]
MDAYPLRVRLCAVVLMLICTLTPTVMAAETRAGSTALAVSAQTTDFRVVWDQGTRFPSIDMQVEVNGVVSRKVGVVLESRPFQDTLGSGTEYRHRWTQGDVQVEREVRLYADSGLLTVGGRLRNGSTREVRLGAVNLLEVRGWSLDTSATEAPAAVYASRPAIMTVVPHGKAGVLTGGVHDYVSTGVLLLADKAKGTTLTVAFLRGDQARPEITASHRLDRAENRLAATSQFLDRVLSAGATVELDRVSVTVSANAFEPLEGLGDAMVKLSPVPVRSGPIALWCSWYAHRMEVSEEKVLANAAVAARHFKPLGFDVMQVDHGWQKGDITGDWVANERFPRGLAWLANELKTRYDLKLGLWISPTDVAETSDLYRAHPEWMLHGSDGRPKMHWKWYWAPYPDCYQIDATRPEVARHIESVFASLARQGVSYFKIDFIAAQGREEFVPHDPTVPPGWPVLRRAMEAVRAGAGDDAWIRYCQTPALLSVGLADGAYGGDDTADAGQPEMFRVLRDNVRILATSFWQNGRGFQREVCDMSVRMHATIEEAQLRAAMMTLANASISWSDELSYLPPSRIRMMQQCLPAGNPPMRPLDLLEREVPSVWHLQPKTSVEAWDVVGLFNLDENDSAVRDVSLAALGLKPDEEVAVFEFWEGRYLGTFKNAVSLTLPPQSSRILSLRRLTGKPQLIGTDMHLLQGYHEVKALSWDETNNVLSGTFQRMPGLSSRAYFLIPDGFTPKFEFPLSPKSARLTHVSGQVWMHEVEFAESDYTWQIPFERVPLKTVKEPN